MSYTHEDTVSTGSSSVWSALSRELSDAAARVTRSIVQVHGRSRPASGIVWAADRVLSTSHSVAWEDGVRVRRHDGTILPAAVAGLIVIPQTGSTTELFDGGFDTGVRAIFI